MAADTLLKHEPINPCCALWKERYLKMKEQRSALRQGLNIYEQQISKIEAENCNLKKAIEEERLQAEIEREEKVKESASRVSLENEISAFKSEILALQRKGGTHTGDMSREVMLLQTRVSEGELEINRLKELLEKERIRADSERKKAESEKKKAKEAWKIAKEEKSRADEEKRLANTENKKAEEYSLRLETLKIEADEAISKLVLATVKSEEASKMFEAERQQTIKEKKRADLGMAKAEEQRKLAETNKKKAMDEKRRADYLSQQLEDHKQRIHKLQKEMDELIFSRKLVGASACLPEKQINADTAKMKELRLDIFKREVNESKLGLEYSKSEEASRRPDKEKQKPMREKKPADADMRKAKKQRKAADLNRKKAMEEKLQADQVAQQLEDNKQRIGELTKVIQELLSSKSLVVTPIVPPDKHMNTEATKMKLLKKQLNFEKMRVKHAKQVAKLEVARNSIVQRELCCLRQELLQFSHRLDTLDKCFLYSNEGIDVLAKTGKPSNMKSLILKTHQAKFHSENELVKPICTSMDGKQTIECSAPFLPISEGNCTESMSGIESKMEPLLKSSSRKMLESSAMNSSTTSFPDRPLLGPQERGTPSVTASANFSEEKLNLQPTFPWLSGEVTKVRYNENLAVVAENSVRSSISSDAVPRRAGHSKKRKRIIDAVESIEHLYSEGKKWHLQIEEKLSTLYAILNSQLDKSLKEGRCSVPILQGNLYAKNKRSHKKKKASPKELTMLHLHDSSEIKGGIEEANFCIQASPNSNNLIETVGACKDGVIHHVRSNQGFLEIFENVVDGGYMKLLELDNAIDEERYRAAIERPLSPTLPKIEFHSHETFEIDNPNLLIDKRSYERFSSEKHNLVPSGSFDVISTEIDSNKFKFNAHRTSSTPIVQRNEIFIDSFENLPNHDNGMDNSVCQGNASVCQTSDPNAELGNSGTSIAGVVGPKISCDSGSRSAQNELPKFCVVFSDSNDSDSISRIFCATRICMAQCSSISQTDCWLRKILHALMKVEDLLPKEVVCVFFSLILHNCSGIVSENLIHILNRDSIFVLDSFAGHICAVMSDAETINIFLELCCLDDLLTLIEDFLIDGRILLYTDVSSESLLVCDSCINILLDGADIMLSFEMASTHQLIAGSFVLASICAAVDHIGFLWEASYNIFRLWKFDSLLMLTILHVFAHLCGSKYTIPNDYGLLMTVLKSLVTFLESENLLMGSASCLLPLPKVRPEFPCTKCPFSEGVVSMDIVVSLLLEKLQNCAFSSTKRQDMMESVNSLNSGPPSQGDKTEQNAVRMNCNASCCLNKSKMPITQSTCIFDGKCFFSDILSLVELVACNMNWDWVYNKIVCQLLKILESCTMENLLVAIVVLLGQLGRHGLDANGYEDIGVENLRCSLYAFLCQSTSRNLGLSIQIATVTSLLGLLFLDFEELMKSNVELPAGANKSVPADCIRKWFSLLSNEQQTLSLSLLQAAGPPRQRAG